MLKTLSKLNTCVYYWNSVENTPNNYGKRFPPLLRVFPVTPTVVNNSVGNGFYDAFPGNSSTQNELKIKKKEFCKSYICLSSCHLTNSTSRPDLQAGFIGACQLGLKRIIWFWLSKFSKIYFFQTSIMPPDF